jgi:hypothetical protein
MQERTCTWTVADDCGNTSEVFTQIITIQDTTAPTWSAAATALNTTVECGNAEHSHSSNGFPYCY